MAIESEGITAPLGETRQYRRWVVWLTAIELRLRATGVTIVGTGQNHQVLISLIVCCVLCEAVHLYVGAPIAGHSLRPEAFYLHHYKLKDAGHDAVG